MSAEQEATIEIIMSKTSSDSTTSPTKEITDGNFKINHNKNTAIKNASDEKDDNHDATELSFKDISPNTLEALKTLSSISSSGGTDKLTNCNKLTASLEQIRANRNMRLFEKLDKIRQDFTGLNHKLAQMEESISDLKEVTSNLIKSLPPDREVEEDSKAVAAVLAKY